MPVATLAPAPLATAAALSLAGLRVVVVDDDTQILAAMEALLGGWGCQVHAAADVAALRPLLLAGTAVPDLLISDFRLRAGASGLDAVAHLRDEFNEDIPAILITGDTAPERLLEAQASQLLLLHKPVHADALRQAITTALAWRTEPATAGATDGLAAAAPAPRQAIGV